MATLGTTFFLRALGTTSRQKGIRQGDPLSPILFNIIADMLAILIERAKADGQVGGLIPHLAEGGCPFYNMRMILFYSWSMIYKRL